MIRKLFMIALAAALAPVAAGAQDGANAAQEAAAPRPLTGKKLLVYVKSDETRQIGLGLFTARMAARGGAAVTVVLGADGTAFALKKGKQENFAATGETPREMIEKVIEFGGEIYVCKLCSTTQGYEAGDFIDGAQIVTMKEIFAVLFQEDIKTLEF